mgnify:CR=1 FL=1
MAAPCIERPHLFLTGRKGVGKSTLLRAMLEGKRLGGFFTVRATGILERPSIHLLHAAAEERPAPENLVCFCGERRTDRFDALGPAEAAAERFQTAVLAALDSHVPVCGVLQQADSAFLRRVAAHPRVRVLTVTEENRNSLRKELVK